MELRKVFTVKTKNDRRIGAVGNAVAALSVSSIGFPNEHLIVKYTMNVGRPCERW
jgi:hypothetical protein